MREIPKYVIAWLLLSSILLTLITIAHGFAIIIRDDTTFNTDDINTKFGDKGRQDNKSESAWDISPVADLIGSLLLGLDMPMPFPLIIMIFNGLMITIIAFCISEIIKAWIPIL